MRLTAQELGGKRRSESVVMSGGFQGSGPQKLPSFSLTTRTREDGSTKAQRVVSTGDRGFFFNGATAYEVPEQAIANVVKLRSAVGTAKGGADLDLSGWLKDAQQEKPAQLDGVSTTHISAKIDPKGAANNLAAVAKAGTPADQPSGLPRALDRKLAAALKSAKIDAYVGTEDRIVRRVTFTTSGKLPKEMLDRGETARWRLTLAANLTDVNRPQQVIAPQKVAKDSPGRRQLAEAAGSFAIGALFLDPPASLVETAAGMASFSAASDAARQPNAVKRAIAADKKVVVFFHQEGADDAATAVAVAAIRRRTSAAVYSDSVDKVASYGDVVSSAGVTRAPSVVVVAKGGNARLIEGYVDPESLAQEVADTR